MQITLDGASADGVGRVELTGPMVAQGYRLLPDHPAFATPGTFRTDDLGRVDDGVLRIIGRADEAISSGGLTILPQVVEAVIVEDPAVAECAVIGLPTRVSARRWWPSWWSPIRVRWTHNAFGTRSPSGSIATPHRAR